MDQDDRGAHTVAPSEDGEEQRVHVEEAEAVAAAENVKNATSTHWDHVAAKAHARCLAPSRDQCAVDAAPSVTDGTRCDTEPTPAPAVNEQNARQLGPTADQASVIAEETRKRTNRVALAAVTAQKKKQQLEAPASAPLVTDTTQRSDTEPTSLPAVTKQGARQLGLTAEKAAAVAAPFLGALLWQRERQH